MTESTRMTEPTPVADLVAPTRRGPGSGRQAWLRASCAILVTLIYLCWWTTFAVSGLTAYGRYHQLEPGAPVTVMGAEFRLISLVQTNQLVNSITDEVVAPPADTVWLVARIEVVRQTSSDYFLCNFAMLGPNRRTWEKDTLGVSRELSSFCDEDSAPLGKPVQVEAIFQVPVRFVDQLAGLSVVDGTSRKSRPVLVPPG